MPELTFLPKLTAALTALNYPRAPERSFWKKPQPGEKYFGPTNPITAHLWLLLMESEQWDNETEKRVLEGIWELHMRGMVAHVEQIDASEVTIDHLNRYQIRDGWKWYVVEAVTA